MAVGVYHEVTYQFWIIEHFELNSGFFEIVLAERKVNNLVTRLTCNFKSLASLTY